MQSSSVPVLAPPASTYSPPPAAVTSGARRARRHWLFALAVLVVVASPPRLLRLGSPGFYGDEDTSALPARAVATGDGAHMPSGMAYRRALPHTWSMALAARVLGVDRELPYRLPAALLGILCVPLLFLVGRRLVRPEVAFLAALAMAVSEWHIVFSRQARMYVPFLFFYLLVALFALRWVRRGRSADLVWMLGGFAGAVMMHALAIFAVMFPVLAFLRAAHRRISLGKVVAVAAGMAGAAILYDHVVVLSAFQAAGAGDLGIVAPVSSEARLRFPISLAWSAVGGMVGLALGAWAAARLYPRSAASDPTRWPRVAVVVTAAASLAAGLLHAGGILLLVLLMLEPGDRRMLWRRAWLPATLALGAAAAWLVVATSVLGPYDGLKAVATFPYPHLALLLASIAGMGAAFAVTVSGLALRRERLDKGVRTAVLAAVLPAAAIGAMSDAGNLRYLLVSYPFVLVVACAGLHWLLRRVAPRRVALPAGAALILSGVLGTHGVWQAAGVVTLVPGEALRERLHVFPFRPDHARPGLDLRAALRPDDIVIAEDVIMQRWYAGRVDYWLRSFGDVHTALRREPGGALRDVYTSSRLLDSPALLDSLLRGSKGRIWVVTSGEIAPYRRVYLEPWQLDWLDGVMRSGPPWSLGADGVTAVYCVNCARAPAPDAR